MYKMEKKAKEQPCSYDKKTTREGLTQDYGNGKSNKQPSKEKY
jgi:hypothetical protein